MRSVVPAINVGRVSTALLSRDGEDAQAVLPGVDVIVSRLRFALMPR
jgi:hypothetical protein